MESRRRRLQTRSTDGGRVVGCPKRTVPFAPWKREGETTVEDTVAAPVNRTDGRTDGRTPMADCSPISRISRTSAPNRLGGMAPTTVGRGGGGDRGLEILFLSFRLLSASPLLPPSTPALSVLKSNLNRSLQFSRFV